MFIEGATKDRSPTIRSECVSGLGQIGPATFRTLLLVLHDGDHTVREAASNAIVKNMTPQTVDDAFAESNVRYQRQSILCSVREIMTANERQNFTLLSAALTSFLSRLTDVLEAGVENVHNNGQPTYQ